ncbi:MAG: hypothetical protein EHM19_10330, partial [Candidatus Latescibacterota bacterium]
MIGFGRPRASGLAEAVLLLAALSAYLALVFVFRDFVIDDTYIAFRYAENFARGGALSFNPDDRDPVEGCTSFSWVLLSAAAIRAGADPLPAVRIVSIASGIGALLLLHRIARRTIGPGWHAAIPVLLLGVSAEFAEWSTAGLETVFFLFFLLLAFDRLLSEAENGGRPLSPIFFALAALTRPEGAALFAGAAALLAFIRLAAPGRHRLSLKGIAMRVGL